MSERIGVSDQEGEYMARIEQLEAALSTIEEGRGRFNRDPLEHATNIIEDMQRIAHDALNGEWEPPDAS